MLELRD